MNKLKKIKKILIVDSRTNELLNIIFTSEKLNESGIKVLSDNADQLEKILSENKGSEYDLFFCHYSIHGKSGHNAYEVLKKYLKDELPKNLILISSIIRAAEAPFETFIPYYEIHRIITQNEKKSINDLATALIKLAKSYVLNKNQLNKIKY